MVIEVGEAYVTVVAEVRVMGVAMVAPVRERDIREGYITVVAPI